MFIPSLKSFWWHKSPFVEKRDNPSENWCTAFILVSPWSYRFVCVLMQPLGGARVRKYSNPTLKSLFHTCAGLAWLAVTQQGFPSPLQQGYLFEGVFSTDDALLLSRWLEQCPLYPGSLLFSITVQQLFVASYLSSWILRLLLWFCLASTAYCLKNRGGMTKWT